MTSMENQDLLLERTAISRSALELLEYPDPDSCWDSCLTKLDSLGVNSLFYGFVTSKLEIERHGMTKACNFRTNHNPKWIDAIGADNLIDFDLSAELIANESVDVFWHDQSYWELATPEQLEQFKFENELGMGVGVSVQLQPYCSTPAMSGVGLCVSPVSAKEFDFYWNNHRTEVVDICHALDFSMRSLHVTDFIGLSPRELEFLTMLAGGYSQKQIAGKWKRSIHTLEKHSRSSRRKLKAGNLEQAVYKAFVLGLIRP